MFRNRNGPKCQTSSFSGMRLADLPGEQSDERGHRRGKPFVKSERQQADQRPAEQADDPSADQPHQKRAFERQIEEPIAGDEAQHHADRQRRHQEQQQHHFLVGVAIFGEDQLAERAEADEQRGQRRRPAHLQDQREQQVSSPEECAHFVRKPPCGNPEAKLANAGGDVKRSCTQLARLPVTRTATLGVDLPDSRAVSFREEPVVLSGQIAAGAVA